MTRPILRRAVPSVEFGEGLSPLLQRIYAARGVRTLSEVRDYGLQHLQRVSTLEAVEEAATLLARHMTQGAHILILGDYDADGATATTLMVRTLKALGHQQIGRAHV